MGAHTHGHSHSPDTVGHHHGHTYDGIDWTEQIGNLRREDLITADAQARIAERLIGLPTGSDGQPVIVDIGAGAGGQSAAFAVALAKRGGGRLIIADAVPELLTAAREHTEQALAGDDRVTIETVVVDAAADSVLEAVAPADIVWASRMVHHLPDQQAGADRLAKLVRAGGWLALSEGGLSTRNLPWDIGIGAPGLQDRLLAARDAAFVRMRAEITGTVPMPYGWTTTLTRAGLTEVTSFSVLTDHPTATPEVRASVAAWLESLRDHVSDAITAEDLEALDALLDRNAPTYVANRDDLFVLGASTIHIGRR
ncbi:methyltransferase [Nocardia sp. NPDC052001]|uniref:class I SAM-dependent methyltransferase n=1 Tax=Nocardia sp. NPDC052001 TaxID=3154853 RepID=UPI00343F673A